MCHKLFEEKPLKNKYLLSTITVTIVILLLATPTGSTTVEDETILALTDLTGNTYTFTNAQFLDMPKSKVNADLYCDGALVTYGEWGGVSLNYLLNQGQPNEDVKSIQFTASDGYKVAIPIDLAIQPQIIIAYELNDQSLAEGLRLVIPDANGAAWISKITIITMSIYGAPYPQAISVGHIEGKTIAPIPESTPKPLPTPQESPIQLQPSPIESSPSETMPTPTNVTQPDAAPTNPPVSNQGLIVQDMEYLVVVVCAVLFMAVAFTVFMRKRNRVSEGVKSVSE